MNFLKKSLLIGTILFPYPMYASSTLPTEKDVRGLINLCAAGRSVEVVRKLEKVFTEGVKREGKMSDLGGIIASIEDEKLQLVAFQMYQSCIMPIVFAKIENEKTEKKKSTINITVKGDAQIVNHPTGTIVFNQ